MKARLFLTISIAATMLWSCQFDDVLSTPSNEGVIRVTSSLTKTESASGPSTGSTTNDNFKNGDKIYVWADKTGTTDGYIKAWELTATGTNGNFSGESKAWPYDGKSLDFHALHGNFTESDLNNKWSDLTSLKHTVLPDQSSIDNRRKSDLLYAEKPGATHGNNVALSFSHLLAKITVKLDLKNSMGITKEDFVNASVSILEIQQEAYFNYLSQTAPTSGGDAINIKAGTIPQPDNMDSETYYAGSAIVPLQTINADQSLIKIILKNNRTFIYKASANTEFQKGQEYTYTLTIRGQQITGSLSVSQFDTADKSISFKDYSDYFADLKNRAYLGSAAAPHDLSYDYNGQMNTANCYVVTHPGYYKIPLVYGNAIKNGATNANAYGSSTFVNHLGNLITDPYIYKNLNNNNVELEAHSAALVWQDAESLINNIGLSSDKHYIQFEITKENIEQGNAVIAVKDGSDIMWSWHIWVTNKNVYETYTYGDYKFMPIALGQRETAQGTTCTFYQWGRKDPFNGTPNKITYQNDYYSSIQNPGKFIVGTSGSPYLYNWFNGSLLDLWNVGNSSIVNNTATSKKTIYDPSPVGFKVPPPAAFYKEMLVRNSTNDFTEGYKGAVDGDFWRAFGYLGWDTGSSANVGTDGGYWSCGPYEDGFYRIGLTLRFNLDGVYPKNNNVRSFGFSVRPVSE